MSDYLNLAVKITALADGSFQAVASSVAGEKMGPFVPPFRLADIAPGLLGPGTTRGDAVDDTAAARAGTSALSAEAVGEQLFRALFQGEIGSLYDRTEGLSQGQQKQGVRIRLSFDLEQDGIAEVAALPWELLRKPKTIRPLLVSTQTVLVRSLDVPQTVVTRPLNGPLRVLLIQSNPQGTGALKLSSEAASIIRSLGEVDGQGAQIIIDEVAPVAELILDQLGKSEYHVIHYMGHGDFEADRGGMLLLEKPDGRPDLVSAVKFATWLTNEPLRLVFLNACDTGTTPQFAGPHPFSGVASALVANNVPAVVAMQFPITDGAALAFSRTFYTSIARGEPVDMAVALGRLALFDETSTEWATPVLYLRAADGKLFDAAAATPAPAVAVTRAEPAATPPLQLNWWRRQNIFVQIGLVLAVFIGLILMIPDAWLEDAPATAPAADAEAPAAEAGPAPSPDATAVADSLANMPPEFWHDDADVNGNSQVWDRLQTDVPDWPDERYADALQALADAGDAKAAFIYAGMLERGEGRTKDIAKASEYFTVAAKGGIPAAMRALGIGYRDGNGQVQNTRLAREWLQKAMDAGSKTAEAELKALPAEAN